MKKSMLILCTVVLMLSACIKFPGEPVVIIRNYKIDFKIGAAQP